jgi:hypothetical protein
MRWPEALSDLATLVGVPFAILVGLFERAYVRVYENDMGR